jgi:MOSC domain-containing protein YiiM
MTALAEVEAVAGGGLQGDRYFERVGFYSERPTDPAAREVTLIEAEALDALDRLHGLALGVDEHRRNLTTRGVKLLDLLGKQFRIGEVVLEGVKDCPPCEHLESLTGKPVIRGLVSSGGLRARIVQGGTLRVSDTIELIATPTAARA